MAQTAVEWLVQELKIVLPVLKDEDEILYINSINHAKEMEKQQIINSLHYFGIENAEQYYNEKFNK
jgi:hypothetical protein